MKFDQATLEALAASGLFDARWYTERYRDVVLIGLTPAEHFLRFGALLERDPSPRFDTLAYLKRYPDVPASAINPLAHYEEYGRNENRVVAEVEPGRA